MSAVKASASFVPFSAFLAADLWLALSPPISPHGTTSPFFPKRSRGFQSSLSVAGSQRGGSFSSSFFPTKRAVERGPIGFVSPSVLWLSTKPLYAPRPLYCLVALSFQIRSQSFLPSA